MAYNNKGHGCDEAVKIVILKLQNVNVHITQSTITNQLTK